MIFCSPLRKEGDKLKDEQVLNVGAMVEQMSRGGLPSRYIPDVEEIADVVASEVNPGDVVLAMSGRNFRGLHEDLLTKLRARFG